MISTFSKSNGRRGTILVFVLVMIVLVSFITAAFMEEATDKIKYYGLFHNQDDLRIDAYSALDSTLAVINMYREIEGALWGPSQGWNDPLAQVGFTPQNARNVSVKFYDESGKFPINSLERETLIFLFREMDFPLSKAEQLTDCFLDWTDEDDARRLDGFDSDDYEDKDPPYKAANAPLKSWDELVLIENFEEAFWDEQGRPLPVLNQFKNAVSLYHDGPVNINSASPLVVRVLQEMGQISAYGLQDYKSGIDGEIGTEDDRLLTEEQAGSVLGDTGDNVSTQIDTLRVEVVASRGEAKFLLQALVRWNGSSPGGSDNQDPDETENNTDNDEQIDDEQPDDENNTDNERQQKARGSAKTEVSSGAELGYPFQIVRLVENRKI